MRKLFCTFAVLAPLLVPADIPPSNIPPSNIAPSTVAPANVAQSRVEESTVRIYEAWAAAMRQPGAFPKNPVTFAPPVNPAMLQLDDPAKLPELRQQAEALRAAGRTVYLAYSPHRKVMELYELPAVLEALRTLAPLCDGFAPAFRRSGAHYGEISRNLAALFCRTARAGNPQIQLLGEVYFGELHGGEGGYGVSVFSFPGCVAFLGVNLPRGGRRQVERKLKDAGISGLNLIDVIPRGVPPHRRYRHRLYIDINNDN